MKYACPHCSNDITPVCIQAVNDYNSARMSHAAKCSKGSPKRLAASIYAASVRWKGHVKPMPIGGNK